jgi:hypothetical protein
MTNDEDLAALAGAQDELARGGFEVVSGGLGGSSGDQLVELHHGSCEVLIGRDRGQLFATIRSSRAGPDYDVGLWEGCLDRSGPPLGNRDFLLDVKTILQRRSEIERAVNDPDINIYDCLRDAGRKRFFARREAGLSR